MHFKILNMELSSIVFTMVRSPYIKGSHLLDRQKYKFKKKNKTLFINVLTKYVQCSIIMSRRFRSLLGVN